MNLGFNERKIPNLGSAGVAIITTLSAAIIAGIMRICFVFIAYVNFLGLFFPYLNRHPDDCGHEEDRGEEEQRM
jgi:hypothetical protein